MGSIHTFNIVAITAVVAMTALMGMVRMGSRVEAAGATPRAIWLGRLAMCATMAAALALAVTGFGTPFLPLGGERLGGWLLLGHVSAGGLFVAGLLGIALFYADLNRFCGCGGRARKLFFWLVLGLGVLTTLTVMISMTPVFNTHGLELMFQAHRWSALALVMSLIGLALSR